MTKTVATATSTYLSAAELLKRTDSRVLRDLCADDGERLSASAILTNANLLALLRDACAEVESACLFAENYSVADLNALVADSGMGAGKLFRLITRLVVGMAFERRPDKENRQPAVYEQALEELRMLRDGERIFSFTESAAAGRADHAVEDAADVADRNGAVYQARRLFGRRANRNDPLVD